MAFRLPLVRHEYDYLRFSQYGHPCLNCCIVPSSLFLFDLFDPFGVKLKCSFSQTLAKWCHLSLYPHVPNLKLYRKLQCVRKLIYTGEHRINVINSSINVCAFLIGDSANADS